MTLIRSVLVANRAEISARVQRTCRALGMRSIAVFATVDADLPFVREADEAYEIGGPAASDSYLHIAKILQAAEATGADAVHPGYGFLAENAAFAAAVQAAGLVWVGPPAAAIETMGDKAKARRLAASVGVPVVPGYDGDAQDDATLAAAAASIGVPLLVKAAAGGGGRGMRRVDDLAALPDALAAARREAAGAFGDDTLLLERFVVRPRHVEVQVLADAHGQVVTLGARDCSIQRRHQKIVEESPPPGLSEATLQQLFDASAKLATAVGYEGAGTVEFVVDPDGAIYFLEMNTRLQVEHPVTEEVWGLDLVAAQLHVAEGRPLDVWTDGEVSRLRDVEDVGHAIEARVYAEDPDRGWLPVAGRLIRADFASGSRVRVDAGYEAGDEVSPHYDSMIAKVIAHGATRQDALRALGRALDDAWVPGVVTNLPLLRALVRDAAFVAGDVHTGFLGEHGYPTPPPLNLEEGARIASLWLASQRPSGVAGVSGWRLTGTVPVRDTWTCMGESVTVSVLERDGAFDVSVGDEAPVRMAWIARDGDRLCVQDGARRRWVRVASSRGDAPLADGDTVYVHLGHGEAMVTLAPRFPAPATADDAPGSCVAPTPGVVRQVHVAEGDAVSQGDALVTMEAMKMEHTLTAPFDGVVLKVRCAPDEAVQGGVLLVQLEAQDA